MTSSRPPFEHILDVCIEDLRTGRATLEQLLALHPQHAAMLEPLLRTATMARGLAIAASPSDAAKRADFMRLVRNTPQQRPRGILTTLRQTMNGLLERGMVIVPAAMAVAIAMVIVFGRTSSHAEASTVTIFSGGMEQQRGDIWTKVYDGEHVNVGAHLRTTSDGRALLTFGDGTTVALDPTTQLTIEAASTTGLREIVLRQESGRLWHQVAPDQRDGSTFAVHTPTAVVTAHGTVFETSIAADGETAVNTAEGLVEVVSGSQRVDVAPGESANAVKDAVRPVSRETRAAHTSTLEVDAPFAASVIGPDGRATGALPNGITYQQIPGAFSTSPTVGAQRIELSNVRSGEYTLLLRRTNDGDGNITFRTPGGNTQSVSLPDGADTYQLRVQVTATGNNVSVIPVEKVAAVVTKPSEAPQERVVVTEKAKERAAEELRKAVVPIRTPEPTSTVRPRQTVTPRPQPTATPTRTPFPTRTPEPRPTFTPRPDPTRTPEPERTPRPTATPDPRPTRTPVEVTPTPTATPNAPPLPTTTPTVRPSATPTSTPAPSGPVPGATATVRSNVIASATPTATATPKPTSTPQPGFFERLFPRRR
ncbi:MAG: hypothetical protein DWI48_02515 [Chloroflexi bacterium]|nr:MAG: hypothetical protein DWI48_02515 [Chloroflexota bacterium]